MAITDDRRNGAAQLPREPFEVEDVVAGGDHTLVLRGVLDVSASDELEGVIISCADAARLTLDLSQLSFMDSSGIKLVLLAHDLSKVRGMRFAVIPGPRQVQRTFEMADLLERLPFGTMPAS
jgi:anti-anti-sigma factor